MVNIVRQVTGDPSAPGLRFLFVTIGLNRRTRNWRGRWLKAHDFEYAMGIG